jgi:phage baseplate assembly protein W
MPIGLTLPLMRNSGSLGYFAFSSTEKEAVGYNMKSLILTNWGERPNHFYFGCNLREFLFSPITEETEDTVVSRIQSQVSNWLPYVNLKDLRVEFPPEQNGHGIRVKIEYGVKGRQDRNSVLVVDVPGQ